MSSGVIGTAAVAGAETLSARLVKLSGIMGSSCLPDSGGVGL